MYGSRVVPVKQLCNDSLTERVVANVSWSVISEVFAKGLFMFTNVYLARTLEVENYGYLSYAQAVAFYFWVAAELGINMYGSREIVRDKEHAADLINNLLTLRLISGATVFLIFLSFLNAFTDSTFQKWIFAGCGLYVLARSTNTDWIMRGFERFRYIAIGNLATFVPMLVFTFFFVRTPADVSTAAVLWSLSYLCGGAALFVILSRNLNVRYRPVVRPLEWRRHLTHSVHFTIAAGSLSLYQSLPVIYVGLVGTDEELGLFSAPYKLVNALTYLLSVLPMALYPIFSDYHQKDRPKFERLHGLYKKAAVAGALATGIAGTLLGREIVYLVYGAAYKESGRIFIILIWFAALTALRVVYSVVIAASGHQRLYSCLSLLGVLTLSLAFSVLTAFFSFPPAILASVGLIVTETALVVALLLVWRFRHG